MYPYARQQRVKHKKGDLIIDNVTNIRKCYDGHKWRRLCSIEHCNKKAQVHGVCMRHSKRYDVNHHDDQTVQSVKQDFTEDLFASTSHPNDFHNQSFNSDSKEHFVLPNTTSFFEHSEFLNATNFTTTSMSMTSSVLMDNNDKQNATTIMKRCDYSTLSNSAIPCRNLGHYKCSHCSFSFCLEHDLQHQQELKGEICGLLNQAKNLYKNIEQLDMNSGNWLCGMRIDQWATTMHMKIDQTRAQLQMKLNLFDGQIQANKDRWKISLRNDIEAKVGRVLMDLLQKHEIDGSRLNKAHQDLLALRNVFNTFDRDQLISIIDDEEETMIFNSPRLNFPNFILNETPWMNNSEENNNSFKDNLIHQINSSNDPFNGYLGTTYESATTSKVIDSTSGQFLRTTASSTEDIVTNHQNKNENFSLNQLESNLLTTSELTTKIENISPRSIEDLETSGIVRTTSDVLSSSAVPTTTINDNDDDDDEFNDMIEQCINCETQHSSGNNKLLHISTTLDLSNSEIGDKEALYLSEVFQNNDTPITLNLACNNIGKLGAHYLSNVLRNNQRLTTLILQSNHIGNQGMEYLSVALRDNTTLTTLDLSCNQIDSEGIRYLCDALIANKTLTTLNLERNQIGEDGARYLSNVLRSNTTLTTLQLRWNRFGDNGTQYLSDALQHNKTLLELNLSYNQIGNAGAQYLSDALKYNTILKRLELRSNQIGDEGIQYLCKTLANNHTLSMLNLLGNEIGAQGAQHLIELKNKNTRLRVHRK